MSRDRTARLSGSVVFFPIHQLLAAIAFFSIVNATPTPAPSPNAVLVSPAPIITPNVVPNYPTKTYKNRRDVVSNLEGDLSSVLAGLGSDIPSYVASGVANFFQDFPSGSAVESSLGIESTELAALPTKVLNIGPYANWTTDGWNVRFHGNVYKQPNISESKLDDLTNDFLIGTSVQDLPASQASQARNLTAEIFVVQQGNVQPLFLIEPTSTSGTQAVQSLLSPYNTTDEGDYDFFSPISVAGLTAGNATDQIQSVPVYVNGSVDGNATAYLVPPTGLTIVSDIDDILRITKIFEPSQGLLNTFAKPFTPWLNMPSIYANWSASITSPAVHFHYLTTTPEQVTRNYESYIYSTYPLGSFDTRPLNFSNVAETLSVRMYMLKKLFATFPSRKFVLVGDVSNSDIMSDYPELAQTTDQVQCIFLRNTTATDSGDEFPYDTSGFKNLNQSKYMFFVTPDDLMGLDIVNGECYNKSVAQNVTFGYQGLLLGQSISTNSSASSAVSASSSASSTSTSTSGAGAMYKTERVLGFTTSAFVLAVVVGLWNGV